MAEGENEESKWIDRGTHMREVVYPKRCHNRVQSNNNDVGNVLVASVGAYIQTDQIVTRRW